DRLQCFSEIFFKLLRRNFGQQQMVVTMDRDLVTLCFDSSNQLRKPFRDPAEHEKRRASLVSFKERQKTFSALANSQLTIVPVVPLDNPTEVVHAKPVFK